ncbi:MAG: hypothetical protein RL748_4557 [Pseudomonadota bacterium]|jgi:hypothetical protein
MLISPPKIAPLEYQGIRYQQDRESKFDGREFAATYLSAIDITTNKQLWVIKVRDCLKYPPGGPGDIALIDISKITPGPNEHELTIETVTATRHVIDLQTRIVTLIYDPDWFVKPRVETPIDESQPPMPPPWPRRRKK